MTAGTTASGYSEGNAGMLLEGPIRFGDYILCPVNQQLQTESEIITLEPKVYEVLCYLINNHQRFVSLEELHQQLWVGRVVSDTAVRRTISKLRAALKDQQEPAQYIQSAAKRGYRWLQPPQLLSEHSFPVANATQAHASSAPIDVPIDVPIEQAEPTTMRETVPAKPARAQSWLLWALPMLLLLGMSAVAYWYWQQPQWQRGEPLQTIEGEKLSLAISPDRKAIVFSSNSLNHPGQELYWYHRDSGKTRQLTSGDHQIMWVIFHEDGKSLIYHDYQDGQYHLYQRPINAEGEWTGPAKALLSPQPVIFQLLQVPNEEKLLISMGQLDAMQIQQLDLVTGTLQGVTHHTTTKSQDYLFAISADGELLTYVRSTPGQPQLLTILQRSTGKVLHQEIHRHLVYRLHFLDRERVLVLDAEALRVWHWPQQKWTPLDANAVEGNFFARGISRSLIQVSEQEWLQGRVEGDIGRMLHQQGPVGELAKRTFLDSGPHAVALYFTADPQQFLVLEQQEKVAKLLLQHTDGSSRTLLEVSDRTLSVQGLHPDGQRVLLLLAGQPHFFELDTAALIPLPVSPLPWQRAMFDAKGEAIILNTMEQGEPVSWRYQLDTQLSTQFHQGQKVVAVLNQDDFIVEGKEHQLIRLRAGQQEILQLPANPQFSGSVLMRQHWLFWGETDLKHTRIYRYDLNSGALEQWQSDRRQMLQRFDISPDGQRWLLRHTARVETKIYPVQSAIR